VDIKGNRIWRGAKTALGDKMHNAAFLRTRIDFIEEAFDKDEVSEIWITFPDPQPKKENKRLTSQRFLDKYANTLQPGGVLHLKTDNRDLYVFTLEVIAAHGHILLDSTDDLYANRAGREEVCAIKTFYEGGYLTAGKKICYIRFRL
jgi:tRNA (guanine-N7-)-methyltransferase